MKNVYFFCCCYFFICSCNYQQQIEMYVCRSTKLSPETKSPAEDWGDTAERGCVISLGYCISLLYPKHMVHLLRFGFTRMEHLNFNSSVETSFSKCVCLVFDYCQFNCSLHIKCYFHFHTLKIAVNLLSDKIFHFPSISKSFPWIRLNTSYLFYFMTFLNLPSKFSVWVLNRRRWSFQ